MPERAWTEREHRDVRPGGGLIRARDEDQFPARQVIRGGRLMDRKPPTRSDRERERRREIRDLQRGGGVRTRDQLYEEAKALGIPGRSKMTKEELLAAVDRRRGRRAS